MRILYKDFKNHDNVVLDPHQVNIQEYIITEENSMYRQLEPVYTDLIDMI